MTRTATGEVQTVKYHELIPMLLNELQRLQQEVADLRAQGQRGATGETAAVARQTIFDGMPSQLRPSKHHGAV